MIDARMIEPAIHTVCQLAFLQTGALEVYDNGGEYRPGTWPWQGDPQSDLPVVWASDGGRRLCSDRRNSMQQRHHNGHPHAPKRPRHPDNSSTSKRSMPKNRTLWLNRWLHLSLSSAGQSNSFQMKSEALVKVFRQPAIQGKGT
jgi:hypothetical protein